MMNTSVSKDLPDNPLSFKKCIWCKKHLPHDKFKWQFICIKCVNTKDPENEGPHERKHPEYSERIEYLERKWEHAPGMAGVDLDGQPIVYTDTEFREQAKISINNSLPGRKRKRQTKQNWEVTPEEIEKIGNLPKPPK